MMIPLKYYGYLEDYQHIIGNSFNTCEKNTLMLLKAIDLFNLDKNQKALKIMQKMLKLELSKQEYAVLYAFMGVIYEDMNKTSSARYCYQKSFELYPISTVCSNLGLIYRSNGDFNKAIEFFNEAIKLNKNNAYPYHNLATLHFRKGELDDALMYSLKALEMKADLYQAAETIALCYYLNEDLVNYKKYYQIAISNGSSKNRIQNIFEDYLEMNNLN